MISGVSMVNLAPVINIALMGLIVALGPMMWVWLKTRATLAPVGFEGEEKLQSRRRLLLLSQITLFLTFDLLVFGAFTRLTDSGLGCPDWPGCYGHTSPTGASAMIEGAQALMPTGPVTHFKAWVEMIHRYLATGVGVLILTIAVFTVSHQYPRNLKLQSLLILFWVGLQGTFGALTVTMRLFPAVVTMHLMGAIILLILLTRFVMVQREWLGASNEGSIQGEQSSSRSAQDSALENNVQAQHIDKVSRVLTQVSQRLQGHQDGQTGLVGQVAHDNYSQVARNTCALLWVGLGIVLIQILLGGWVSTNYAVTACTSFPMCQNSWWPLMNFREGFELWRPLGLSSAGVNLNFEALTAIHYTHRLSAYVVFAFMCVLGYVLRKQDHYKTLGGLIWVLIALQVLTGVSNVVFQWPLVAAVMHTAGAAALVIVLTLGIKMGKMTRAHFHGAGELSKVIT